MNILEEMGKFKFLVKNIWSILEKLKYVIFSLKILTSGNFLLEVGCGMAMHCSALMGIASTSVASGGDDQFMSGKFSSSIRNV